MYLGVSPFLPTEYKVWYNIKDFRARGNRKTNNTSIINKAIFNSTYCREIYKTSIIALAIVYFPPKIYLVSKFIM